MARDGVSTGSTDADADADADELTVRALELFG